MLQEKGLQQKLIACLERELQEAEAKYSGEIAALSAELERVYSASSEEELQYYIREIHQAKSEVLEVLSGSSLQAYQGHFALNASLLQDELNGMVLIKEQAINTLEKLLKLETRLESLFTGEP